MKVIITGGNKGIGYACTKLFLDAGHEVIILARESSSVDIQHNNLTTIDIDLIDSEGIDIQELGIQDAKILINNAGIMNGIGHEEYTSEQRKNLMKLNVEVPVMLISKFSTYMKTSGGRIVNIGSIAGHIGHKDIWYGISKAAIHNLTKSFAKELGSHGIQVNCIAPGPVNTDMLRTISEERKEKLKKASITNRFAEPEEIAKTIYRLATDAPEYINGVCIDIKDGMHFRS